MTSDGPTRNLSQAMRRGVIGRCPNCGTGKLFTGYLTVSDRCNECKEPLRDYKTADLPAVFTILIVGILLVPILWVGFVVFRPEPLVLFGYISVLTVLLTLVLLRLVKGANLGYLWAI